jgi:hypothetical protein
VGEKATQALKVGARKAWDAINLKNAGQIAAQHQAAQNSPSASSKATTPGYKVKSVRKGSNVFVGRPKASPSSSPKGP